MPKDATFLVLHRLSEDEINDLCEVIEFTLVDLGITEPNVLVSVTEDENDTSRS